MYLCVALFMIILLHAYFIQDTHLQQSAAAIRKKMSDAKIYAPTTMAVYGPTQSGKTEFILRLLKNANEMFTERVEEIHYCYSVYQKAYDKIKEVEGVNKVVMHQGMPLVNDCVKWSYLKNHIIVVFDDLMTELPKNRDMIKFATVNCHHNNITMIILLHNIFEPGLRTLSLNIHYVVLFKNKRDSLQVKTFGRRIVNDGELFYGCFKLATERPYGYLLVDLHPRSDEKYLLRTRIFPNEAPPIIYNDRGKRMNVILK